MGKRIEYYQTKKGIEVFQFVKDLFAPFRELERDLQFRVKLTKILKDLGFRNKYIADILGVSTRQVQQYVKIIKNDLLCPICGHKIELRPNVLGDNKIDKSSDS